MPAGVPAKSFKIALHKGTKTLPTHLHMSIASKWMDVRTALSPPPPPVITLTAQPSPPLLIRQSIHFQWAPPSSPMGSVSAH